MNFDSIRPRPVPQRGLAFQLIAALGELCVITAFVLGCIAVGEAIVWGLK